MFRAQLGELLRWRRDVRHFGEAPLPAGMMDRLFAAAHCAPSVGNSRPWRFVAVRSPGLRGELARHADEEAERAGKRYASSIERHAHYDRLKLHGLREAPEVLAVFSATQPHEGHGLGRATMPETLDYSTVLAIHTLWLAARAEGIGMGWVSIVDPAFVHARLDVPTQWRFIALLCLGYPSRDAAEPELQRLGWQDNTHWSAHVTER